MISALHWYDLTCPFCYVSQDRDEVLAVNGVEVTSQPFRAHPDIPPFGIVMGQRSGPMYERLENEAKLAGLPLRWPARLPSSRLALGVAEWVRCNRPHAAGLLRRELYAAHFAFGLDISDADVVERLAAEAGVSRLEIQSAIHDGMSDALLLASERRAREAGVVGTPAWLIDSDMISGLHSVEFFQDLVQS